MCNSPSVNEQLHKNKGAYPQESADEGQSKSTSVCLFAFVTFSFTESSCSSPLYPLLAFSEDWAICPQQCRQFNLIQRFRSACTQTIVVTGCWSCQSAVQTPERISPISTFLCCLTDIDHPRQDRNTCCCLCAAQCLSLSLILCFCSSTVLTFLFFLN